MLVVRSTPIVVRRFLARHPLIYWSIVAVALLMLAASVTQRVGAVDDARESWGDTRRVWVATVDHSPGDLLTAEPASWPAAMIAGTAASTVDGQVARQRISAGEVIDIGDTTSDGPRGLIPEGWVALAIVESPGLGVRVGAQVRPVADGVELTDHAVVIAVDEQRTVIAVDDSEAPPIALAASDRSVSLLLLP